MVIRTYLSRRQVICQARRLQYPQRSGVVTDGNTAGLPTESQAGLPTESQAGSQVIRMHRSTDSIQSISVVRSKLAFLILIFTLWRVTSNCYEYMSLEYPNSYRSADKPSKKMT